MTAMEQATPTLGEFIELAKQGNVIPVFAEFIADGETPVSAFKKLDDGGYSFLFESTEKNDVSGRFSFVGMDPRVVLQSYGRKLRIVKDGKEREFETSSNPLDDVRNLVARYQFVSQPELPRFAGGAVGFIGYEAIHSFEPKVPLAQQDELHLPEALFMIPSVLLVFDHRLRSLKIIVNTFLSDGCLEKIYARATQCLASIKHRLMKPVDLRLLSVVEDAEQPLPRSNFSREEFENAVKRAKEYIVAGDVFQVVLSQRFEAPFNGEPVSYTHLTLPTILRV